MESKKKCWLLHQWGIWEPWCHMDMPNKNGGRIRVFFVSKTCKRCGKTLTREDRMEKI